VRDHLDLTIDLRTGEFRAPFDKLQVLSKHASSLLGRAVSTASWLPAKQLAAFVGKAQFLYLAIAPASFFLRVLHSVLSTRQGWGGRVRMTNQLKRDLEWCPTNTTDAQSTSPSKRRTYTPTQVGTDEEPC
jgi:hypothetical protein